MKKAVYVLSIGDYFPELCALTLPTIEAYALRIKASFNLIEYRKYQAWPITYEKVQIFHLGETNDWNIFVDADTLISPALYDVTTVFPPDHIGVFMAYKASRFFPMDHNFLRDGRDVGLATNFIVTSRLCHDLWTPFEEQAPDILARLKLLDTRPHIVDEYCLSRNLARFGLKYSGIVNAHLEHFLHLSVTTENASSALDQARKYLEHWQMPVGNR